MVLALSACSLGAYGIWRNINVLADDMISTQRTLRSKIVHYTSSISRCGVLEHSVTALGERMTTLADDHRASIGEQEHGLDHMGEHLGATTDNAGSFTHDPDKLEVITNNMSTLDHIIGRHSATPAALENVSTSMNNATATR